MKLYVAGFLFNDARNECVVVEKNHPEFQKGKHNAVGGEIKEGETPIAAMVREFKEETGFQSSPSTWAPSVLLVGKEWAVFFFIGFLPQHYFDNKEVWFKSMEQEIIKVVNYPFHINNLPRLRNLDMIAAVSLDPTILKPMFMVDEELKGGDMEDMSKGLAACFNNIATADDFGESFGK